MSLIISAGSAQFILAPLLTDGTPLLLAVLVVFVVNIRHALYSATLAPFLRSLGARWKWLLAYLLSDETFAVVIGRYRREDDSPHKHWYFLGSGLSLWVCWNASTAAGIFPALLLNGGSVNLSAGNARLIAGVAAIGVAWFSRNVVLTIAAGMVVLVAMLALGG